jgi:hypothetical protein
LWPAEQTGPDRCTGYTPPARVLHNSFDYVLGAFVIQLELHASAVFFFSELNDERAFFESCA